MAKDLLAYWRFYRLIAECVGPVYCFCLYCKWWKEEELLTVNRFYSHHVRDEMLSLQQASLKERYAFPISEYARYKMQGRRRSMNHFCKAWLTARPRGCTRWHYRYLHSHALHPLPRWWMCIWPHCTGVLHEACSKGDTYCRCPPTILKWKT